MSAECFTVVGWTNGKPKMTAAGYGLKIRNASDRNNYFKREWGKIELRLPNLAVPAKININKDSFWTETCRELIGNEIGLWLLRENLAPWLPGSPPQVLLISQGDGIFEARRYGG